MENLKKFEIENVVDVRRFPTSKKFPHFKKESLSEALQKDGIKYFHLGDNLGGFRKGGYRNYTKTKEFKRGLRKLIKIGKEGRTAIMCAELLFFLCHRRYIADELVKEGHQVTHIIRDRVHEHGLIKKYVGP